jgi:phosphoribosylaminoimidazole-succinocarboxamide synthase
VANVTEGGSEDRERATHPAGGEPGQAGGEPDQGGGEPDEGGLQHLYSGKVRDLYQAADGVLLLVASDRISAFDYVLEPGIPDKGRILTRLTEWWFERLADLVPNHLVDAPVPARFAGRAMACRPLSMVPVECVARGYLTGTGLADYRRDGAVAGVMLPDGLTDGSRLPEPIFDPDSKAPQGEHDENLTKAELVALVGEPAAAELERVTLAVYQRGASLAAERGIIVADTKIELGFDDAGVLRLADEVLTPDSSRFWPAESWQPGRQQPSYDKQYVRDWLTSAESGWDRTGTQPPPPLPSHVVERTRERYVAAYERITGMHWADQR